MKFLSLLLSCSILVLGIKAQTYGLSDGRNRHSLCVECKNIVESRPKEVAFGIHFYDNDVYFATGNEDWFNKIFSQNTDGIAADIVTRFQTLR